MRTVLHGRFILENLCGLKNVVAMKSSSLTNMYRALAARRRQDADREERRRQEILARRREDIRAATEKYQRLNKHYHAKSDAG